MRRCFAAPVVAASLLDSMVDRDCKGLSKQYILYDIRRNLLADTRIAKLFKNGASQAVRLPAEFRFEGDQVFITRDDKTGDVTLSARPGGKTWAEFYAFMETVDVPEDFMATRPMNRAPRARALFNDED